MRRSWSRRAGTIVSVALVLSSLAMPSVAAESNTLARADELLAENKPEEARESLEAHTTAHPDDPSGFVMLGRALLRLNDPDAALKSFKRAVELDPESAKAHRWLGEAYVDKLDDAGMLKKLGLARKARASFERAVELDPRDVNARDSLMTYYLEAPGIAGGSADKARLHAGAAIEIDPLRGHRMMAKVHQKLEEHDEAEAALRKVTTLDSGPRPWFELGLFLQGRERFADAGQAFDKALEIDPDHIASLYQIGRSGALSGQDLERARRALEEYLQREVAPRNPSHAWAQYRLGMVHRHAGDTAAARRAFEAAIGLDPEHQQARKALEELEG